MRRVCVVEVATGLVENVIELGGELPEHCVEDASPPGGVLWIEHASAGPGWVLQGGQLVDPNARAPSELELAEIARTAAIETSVASATLGAVLPKTAAELKAMTLQQYEAWFDANFDTAPRLIELVKRVLLRLIRRLL